MNNTDKTYGLFNNKTNKRFIEKMENDGKKVIKFPKVEKNNLEISEQQRSIIANLQQFDWLIVTDVFAADHFIEMIALCNGDLFELDNVRVCAFGEAVADKLRFVQIHSDVITNKIDDEYIFDTLRNYLIDIDEFYNLNFLFVQESDKHLGIKNLLSKQRANFTAIEVYQNIVYENITKQKLLINNGAVDEFILNSAEEVFDLINVYLIDTLSNSREELNIRATNDTAFQTSKEFGFKKLNYKQKRG